MEEFILTSGRPAAQLTDQAWQILFESFRSTTISSSDRKMRKSWNEGKHSGEFYGVPNYQYYVLTINDILRNIRSGGSDYCYYTYQICDLLKFEKSRLRSQYLPEEKCWIVWLEGGKPWGN